jgi:hypothetical protein
MMAMRKKKNYQKIVINLLAHLASKLLHQRVGTSKALFGKCETQTHQRIDVSSCIPCSTQVHSILGVELMLVWLLEQDLLYVPTMWGHCYVPWNLFSISLFSIERGPNSPSFCKLPVYSHATLLVITFGLSSLI